MTRLAVTGATGYIGRHLLSQLTGDGHDVVALVRREPSHLAPGVEYHVTGDLAENTADPAAHIAGVTGLIHLASPSGSIPVAHQERVHVRGTEVLLEAARAAGVQWFCYVSSIKAAAGECADAPVSPAEPAHPNSDYGRFKRTAELRVLGADLPAATVLRLPMVYGPDSGGNFARLCSWVRSPWPVPRFAEDARRSIVFVANVTHALSWLVERHAQAAPLLQVADPEPVSTNDLLEMIAEALRADPLRVPVPAWLAAAARKTPGVRGIAERLTGALEMDTTALRDAGWQAPHTTVEGIASSV